MRLRLHAAHHKQVKTCDDWRRMDARASLGFAREARRAVSGRFPAWWATPSGRLTRASLELPQICRTPEGKGVYEIL